MLHQTSAAGLSEDRELLRRLQQRRKVWLRALVCASALALLFIELDWLDGSVIHELLETAGLILILVCIAGRAWSILYIGGRKTNELVDLGPYSVSRNPLYMFSFLGALGVGLQSGSIVIGLICLAVAAIVFVPVVYGEEEVLARTFGQSFQDYKVRVPRFGPRLSTWQDAKRVTFSPVLLYGTVRDSLVFACAFPVFELIAVLQNAGYLPVILRVP